jgi:CheY-like chemotaxis protein
VSQVFIRSDQLAEKVQELKLLMPEWKVLFALDGKMAVDEIASFLEMKQEDVENSVEHLRELGVIHPEGEAVSETAEEPSEEMPEFGSEEPEETLSEEMEGMAEFSEESETPEFMEEPEDVQEQEEPPVSGEDFVEELTEEGELEISSPESEEITEEDSFEDENLEELNLEEEAVVETEEETEEDLDSLINDLLKEESAAEEGGEGPKILDEEEMAKLDTEIDLPEDQPQEEEPSTTGDEPESTETEMETSFIDTALGEETDQETMVEAPAEEEIAAEPEPEEVVTPPEPTGDMKTILVVDDSIVIRKMVEIALENEHYEVVSVATGKDAFSYLDANNPNLIILDIMLPDMNGLDILKAIKASKTIPVVMLSAKDTPKETSQAKDLGADDFIPKPFRDEELVSKIHELIGR